jgi:hypothetical protein
MVDQRTDYASQDQEQSKCGTLQMARLSRSPCHKAYKIINRNFGNAIEKAKSDHWKEWIEHVDGDNIWTVHEYMKADPTDYGKQRIPELKTPNGTTATTTVQKAEQLASMFFPPKRPHNVGDRRFDEHNLPRAPVSNFPYIHN